MISFAPEVSLDKAPDAFRTISEVAEDLDLPQHVLRFWETRFSQIKPLKRGGGRRYYRPEDVALLKGIRYLLYGEGYTIKGVQRILKDEGPKFVQNVWMEGAPAPRSHPQDVLDETKTPLAAGFKPVQVADRTPREQAESLSYIADQERIVHHSAIKSSAIRPIEQELHQPSDRSRSGFTEQLQAVLSELGECRRVLALALADTRARSNSS